MENWLCAECVRNHRARQIGPNRPTAGAVRWSTGLFPAIVGVALAQTIDTAHAQGCNLDPSPTAPSVANVNVSGATYSPQSPLSDGQAGEPGCDGGPGSAGESGGPGLPGQPGPTFSAAYSAVTINGFVSSFNPFTAAVTASGGDGGDGGTSGSVDNNAVNGGDGGPGGSGGDLTMSFGGTLAPIAGTQELTGGLSVLAIGGEGGDGGDSSESGIYGKEGGQGGDGGAGGTVNLTLTSGSISAQDALQVDTSGGAGGFGGDAFTSDVLDEVAGGDAGSGGSGGSSNLTVGSGVSIAATDNAVLVEADGGIGQGGGLSGAAGTVPAIGATGGTGGTGGNGGTATASFSGTIDQQIAAVDPTVISAIAATANGGNGGDGGTGNGSLNAGGGSGGDGGAGGSASLTFTGSATVVAPDGAAFPMGQALLAQASGGFGGYGAKESSFSGFGGNGGSAGGGGTAALTLGIATTQAQVATTGTHLHGAVAQSVGGGGGDGGSGAGFATSGGAGSKGGDGGGVTVTAPGIQIITNGDSSKAIVAQSVGGGGGIGGDSTEVAVGASIAIGGNGGFGGDGAPVSATIGGNMILGTMSETGGGGVLAQSVGGSGGSGGNATSKGVGFLAMTIGGGGGTGGRGSQATIDSAGLVTTYGDHAPGLHAQSVGGGGGNGGVAVSTIGGVVPIVAVAVGGSGSVGGTADLAQVSNDGQVTTYGSDAAGLKAQSIGGGGGSGGSATATAIDVSPNNDIPAVSVSFAAGGAGGTGNTAGKALVTNTGIVTTAGHGAFGSIAQSVGGGGGTAGDSTAASWTGGGEDTTVDINVSIALGGNGGVGGDGGEADNTNSGFIYTTGQHAYGLFGQSVGGGGGAGGTGDSSATSVLSAGSVSVAVAVGGTGAGGGTGGVVNVGNSGQVATSGDSSDGVFGQSVGGGGGNAGGGTSANNGGKLGVAVGVGGNGGAGGDGGAVTGSNSGLIATNGTDSMGLAAQSVGGGGGRGGKAGATSDSSDSDLPKFVYNQISQGFGFPEVANDVIDGIFSLKDRILTDLDTLATLKEKVTGNVNDPDNPRSFSPEIDVTVAVGGKGGAAGDGGTVTLTNTGQIGTEGAHSDAVIGQSVGGGGGIGGGSSASGTETDDTRYEFSLSMGGAGGAAGNGGAVLITHTGLAQTGGVGAFGVVGQSIGGGGGRGGASGDDNGSLLSFGVSLGGAGGATGSGGPVTIQFCQQWGSGCQAGSVSTTGKHAIGVLAQSVGGGGGLIRTLSLDQQGNQSNSDNSNEPDNFNVFLDFGQPGAGGASGSGGLVQAYIGGGSVTTTGRNAHGVVGLSIGGGGGAVGGGVVNLIQRAANADPSSGDGGEVDISLEDATVSVSGTNSVALWGASIGGGGAALLTDSKPGAVSDQLDGQSGNAKNVVIALNNSKVSASGGSPAIIAHSIAGGGVSPADGGGTDPSGGNLWESVTPDLTYYGLGIAGDAIVTLGSGSSATATDSSAIVAASMADRDKGNDGSSTANALVVIENSAATNASADHPTIMFLSILNPSILRNEGGTITNTVTGGYAVSPVWTATQINITNSGTITGNIDAGSNQAVGAPLAAAAPRIDNRVGGVLAPYDTIAVEGGLVRNAGVIAVSGARHIGRTELDGDLEQLESGRLRFKLDAARGRVDRLHVTGSATLDGGFEIAPVTLLPRRFEVMTAAGGLSLLDSFASVDPHVFVYNEDSTATTLAFTPSADFSAPGSEGERGRLARHLQRIWDDGGVGFASGFAALAGVNDAGHYATALDAMSARSVAAVGYARYLNSQWFARVGHSCPAFDEASVVRTEHSCGWLQVRGSALERDASGSDPGFDFNSVITAVGGQAEVGDGIFVGGAIGWEDSDLSDDADSTSIDGDALLASATVKREAGPWTLSGAVDLGYGSFDSSRDIRVGTVQATASGSSNASNAGLHFRVAYEIPRDGWYAEPAVDVDLNYLGIDDYTETGAGDFDLAVDSSNATILTGTPWIKVGRRADLSSGGTLNAYASAGVSLSAGEDFDITARFASAPPGTGNFTTTLDNPGVVGRLSAGVELFATDRVQLRLQYDGSFADNQTENAGQIRLAYFF